MKDEIMTIREVADFYASQKRPHNASRWKVKSLSSKSVDLGAYGLVISTNG